MSFSSGGTTDGVVITATRGTNSSVIFKDGSNVTQLEVNTAAYTLKASGKINATTEMSASRLKLFQTITALAGSSTVTIAQYLTGIIKYTIGGNTTQTTDTAANIIASVGNTVGTTFFVTVYQGNTNRSITVTAGTGVTIFDGRANNSVNAFKMTFIVTSGTAVDVVLS